MHAPAWMWLSAQKSAILVRFGRDEALGQAGYKESLISARSVARKPLPSTGNAPPGGKPKDEKSQDSDAKWPVTDPVEERGRQLL